ncbi:MAG TPA: tyrosine-type recombinase/integrase [Streptosporangiaceae bacterium]
MSSACRVRVTGPLAMYADGFRADLAARGYAAGSADRNLRTLAHVSRWMDGQRLSAGQLSAARLEEFLAARRREGYHHALSIRAVMPLVRYLRGVGVGVPGPAAGSSTVDRLAGEYCRYLAGERALTAQVTARYTRLAREFLLACLQPGGPGLAGLPAAWVTDYVVAQCGGRRPGSAKLAVTALRSLLRFLFLAGHTRCQLACAVPTVAHWGAGSLPRALSPETVAALLASCDTATLAGRRDRAILVLLARLGLRAGEVAGLALEDLDWRAGEISIRGKGSRRDRLPLPADVGEALVAYLHGGRPRAGCRTVFLRLNAPAEGLTVPAVTAVVYRACARAGLPRAGAHRLRHSAASAMLAGGGTLTEVGQVLRHVRLETTAIYAKIDQAALRGLARPWPGGAA